jgi:hypothetical protein
MIIVSAAKLGNLFSFAGQRRLTDNLIYQLCRRYNNRCSNRPQVLKINRNLNATYSLARLAFSSPAVQSQEYVPCCSYEHLDLQ